MILSLFSTTLLPNQPCPTTPSTTYSSLLLHSLPKMTGTLFDFRVGLSASGWMLLLVCSKICPHWALLKFITLLHFFSEGTAKLNWFWRLYMYFGVCRFFVSHIVAENWICRVGFILLICVIFRIKRAHMWFKSPCSYRKPRNRDFEGNWSSGFKIKSEKKNLNLHLPNNMLGNLSMCSM